MRNTPGCTESREISRLHRCDTVLAIYRRNRNRIDISEKNRDDREKDESRLMERSSSSTKVETRILPMQSFLSVLYDVTIG